MTTLLVVLIVWAVLSVPAALILARMFRSAKPRTRTRGRIDADHELSEFDSRTGEFAARHRNIGEDT
ncbi:hypothetical protein [Nocardia sp. NBC_00511]|uniref:hypothetical protein n=1 Tax=Nocardia sp. NBC_00511 TaxID=2903591 RepID=UPI0030E1C048